MIPENSSPDRPPQVGGPAWRATTSCSQRWRINHPRGCRYPERLRGRVPPTHLGTKDSRERETLSQEDRLTATAGERGVRGSVGSRSWTSTSSTTAAKPGSLAVSTP